ncbi:MAG: prenyltransferase/squalene oxidase repeat-containing protein [Acidobacteriota bacterium]
MVRVLAAGLLALSIPLALWAGVPEERAVAHLSREVPAWFAENRCYSCHNNGDAARALLLARAHGYGVADGALAGTLEWLRHPERWDSNRGDVRFSDKDLARLQFSVALVAAGGKVPVEALVRMQASDGAWHVAGEEGVSSPVTWGTALATALVRGVIVEANPAAAKRAEEYLRGLALGSTVDAAAVLLAIPGDKAAREYLLGAVTSDGAWGAKPHVPAEAFDTAMAMLALQGVEEPPHEVLRRGRAWLVAHQLEGGGWPETTRPSGGTSYAQHVSTTAWALMALLGAQ